MPLTRLMHVILLCSLMITLNHTACMQTETTVSPCDKLADTNAKLTVVGDNYLSIAFIKGPPMRSLGDRLQNYTCATTLTLSDFEDWKTVLAIIEQFEYLTTLALINCNEDAYNPSVLERALQSKQVTLTSSDNSEKIGTFTIQAKERRSRNPSSPR